MISHTLLYREENNSNKSDNNYFKNNKANRDIFTKNIFSLQKILLYIIYNADYLKSMGKDFFNKLCYWKLIQFPNCNTS